MKKLLCFAVLIAMAACFCACGNVADIPVATAEPALSVAEESAKTMATETLPNLEPAEKDAVIIGRFAWREESFSDQRGEGIEILSYAVQFPTVEVVDHEDVSATINAVLSRACEKYFPSEEGSSTEMDAQTMLLTEAEDNFMYHAGTGEPVNLNFSLERSAKIVCADNDHIAVEFTNYTVTNEETTETEMYVFSTKTGELLDGAPVVVKDSTDFSELECVPLADFNGDGDILDLIILEPDGGDYLYGPAEGKTAYNVCIEDYWFCNLMENSFVQIRTKSLTSQS